MHQEQGATYPPRYWRQAEAPSCAGSKVFLLFLGTLGAWNLFSPAVVAPNRTLSFPSMSAGNAPRGALNTERVVSYPFHTFREPTVWPAYRS